MQTPEHTSSSLTLSILSVSEEDGEESQLEDAAGPSSGAANGRSKKSRFRGVTTASKDPTKFVAQIAIRGRSVQYLGLYEEEVEAARAFDRAAIRLRGVEADLNFSVIEYAEELPELLGAEATPSSLLVRKKPKASKYRGVGRVNGSSARFTATITHEKKPHYLGAFDTEEAAAAAYDTASLALKGPRAFTNLPARAASSREPAPHGPLPGVPVTGSFGPLLNTPDIPDCVGQRPGFAGSVHLADGHWWASWTDDNGQTHTAGPFLSPSEAARAYL